MKKFSIFTIGCRTNIAESEKLRAILSEENFQYTENPEEANYIFINTCTVTHKADRDSRKIVNRIKKLNKKAKIYIFGCAFYLFKGDERTKILNYETLLKEIKKDKIEESVLPPEKSGHSRYFLKIQEGCNYRCTFCIIPFKRGKSRSIPLESLIHETKVALSKGYMEIVLTGTQIGDYGKDIEKDLNLKILIEKLLDIDSNFRIRLSSLHPSHFYKIFDLLTEKRIAPHLHIPLQSASEKILRDMKRPYSLKFFDETINKILKINRNFSIGTDLIIGFPTEKDKEFKETVNYLKNSPFSYIHVFSYSKREGTPAAELKEIEPHKIKEKMEIIKEIDKEKREKFMKSLLNKIIKPVYEKKENGFLKGLSEYGFQVKFKGNKIKKGEITNVFVNKIENKCLIGFKLDYEIDK